MSNSIEENSTTGEIVNHHRSLVLMYHSIAEPPANPNDLWVSPNVFKAQMSALKVSGLRGVSVREMRLALSEGRGGNMVALTFDDGYRDFLDSAVPTLESFGFTGTVFAVTGRLGGENDWDHHFDPRPTVELMDEEDLREVTGRGMEVAAHTVTHPSLVRLSSDAALEEMTGSREALSGILGEEVQGFCYPYGRLSADVVRMVGEAGYEYGCAISTRQERSEMDLPRIGVREIDTPLRFIAKVRLYRSAYGRWKLYR